MGRKKGKEVRAEHPIVQKKIDKSLDLSIKEGSLTSISTGLGLSYFPPFALVLNATSSQIGILYAILNLLPSIVQLKSAVLIKNFSRKKIVLNGVLGQISAWILILIIGFLFYIGIPYMVWAFIFLVGLFYVFSAIIKPAWFSWMGSLVPEKRRGKYFSRRNRFVGIFGILAMTIGAVLLDGAKKFGEQYGNIIEFTLIGFGLLFTIAIFSQILTWFLLKKQYEPRICIKKKDYFSFWDFLKRSGSTKFGRFVLFRGFFGFAVGVASPFWTVYMLRDLGFSYIWYMIIIAAGIGFQLMFLPLIGNISDKFGNIKLITICSWLISLIPILWLISGLITNDLGVKFYLLFVPAIVSGFAWAGYNLAVNNYVYDAVNVQKRGFCLSYMNLLVGVGIFIGAALGSLLAWINVPFMNSILFIFAISAFSRFLVVISGLKFLHEVRYVRRFSSQYLIKGFQPMQGAVREIHNLEYIVKRVEHFILPEEEVKTKEE